MKALKYEHQSILPLWVRVKLNFRDRYGKPNIVFNNSSCYQVFSSNSQKLSLWCKKKNHSSPIWICMTHIWSPTLFPRCIITFQGVLTKFNFLMKFPYLEKIVNLMKYLNGITKAFIPCRGGSNLILGTGIKSQIFILRTPAAVKFF